MNTNAANSGTYAERLLHRLLEFTALNDEASLRSRYTFFGELLDEAKSVGLSAAANLESAIPVQITKLAERLQRRLDAVNAVYDAKKTELEAELKAAEGFEDAVKAWYKAINDGLADGTYEIDVQGREGVVVATDPNTHAVPGKPTKKDVTGVQAKLKELEVKRVNSTKNLQAQLDILAMADGTTVQLTTNRWTNELNAPLPTVESL